MDIYKALKTATTHLDDVDDKTAKYTTAFIRYVMPVLVNYFMAGQERFIVPVPPARIYATGSFVEYVVECLQEKKVTSINNIGLESAIGAVIDSPFGEKLVGEMSAIGISLFVASPGLGEKIQAKNN